MVNVQLIAEYEDVDTTRVSTLYTGVQTQVTQHLTCEDTSRVLGLLYAQSLYTQHRACELSTQEYNPVCTVYTGLYSCTDPVHTTPYL